MNLAEKILKESYNDEANDFINKIDFTIHKIPIQKLRPIIEKPSDESLTRFDSGIRQPIYVEKGTNFIKDGNHRYFAALKMGLKEMNVIFIPEIPIHLNKIVLTKLRSKKILNLVDKILLESIKLPINIGDTILTGKFRNHKVIVKEIGKDEYGLPTINGKSILKIRIAKLMPKKKKIKESNIPSAYETEESVEEYPSERFAEKTGMNWLYNNWKIPIDTTMHKIYKWWDSGRKEDAIKIYETYEQLIKLNPPLANIKVTNLNNVLDVIHGAISKFNFDDIKFFTEIIPQERMAYNLKNRPTSDKIEKKAKANINWVMSPITRKKVMQELQMQPLQEVRTNVSSFQQIHDHFDGLDKNQYAFITRDTTHFISPEQKLKAAKMIEKYREKGGKGLPTLEISPLMLLLTQRGTVEAPGLSLFVVKLNMVYYVLSGKETVVKALKDGLKTVKCFYLNLDNY